MDVPTPSWFLDAMRTSLQPVIERLDEPTPSWFTEAMRTTLQPVVDRLDTVDKRLASLERDTGTIIHQLRNLKRGLYPEPPVTTLSVEDGVCIAKTEPGRKRIQTGTFNVVVATKDKCTCQDDIHDPTSCEEYIRTVGKWMQSPSAGDWMRMKGELTTQAVELYKEIGWRLHRVDEEGYSILWRIQ
jgi:hypothetical protein